MTAPTLKATTIKVSPTTRDRINEIAAETGRTADSVIEMLLDAHLRRLMVERVKRQMLSASPEEWADYLAESREWDVTSADGLQDDPWQE